MSDPRIRLWRQRSRDLLAHPERFTYDDWCAGGLARTPSPIDRDHRPSLSFPPHTSMRLPITISTVLLSATAAAAQDAPRECPRGPADNESVVVSMTTDAHPTRLASALDSILAEREYQVRSSPAGTGQWSIVPRFTWLEAVRAEDWHDDEHPGVQLDVATEARGDSTHVRIGARTLCVLKSQEEEAEAGSVETMLEVITATDVAAALAETLDAARDAGVPMREPVPRSRISLSAPEAVGPYRLIGRQDYDDPRLGTNVRYAMEDGRYVDVYVYPGPPPAPACADACVVEWVDTETRGFRESLPELVRRGQYGRAEVEADDVLAPAAGDAWRAGRHLTLKVAVQGEPRESHYYLFAYPGYMVKARATFPELAETRDGIAAFVRDLLVALVQGS